MATRNIDTQSLVQKIARRIVGFRKKKKKKPLSSPRIVDAVGAIGERQRRRREELGTNR